MQRPRTWFPIHAVGMFHRNNETCKCVWNRKTTEVFLTDAAFATDRNKCVEKKRRKKKRVENAEAEVANWDQNKESLLVT